MLNFHAIQLRVAGKLLIETSSVTLPSHSKIGFIGANGSGKSSLFRAILGEIAFESGEVQIPKGANFATIEQEISTPHLSPLAYLISAHNEVNLLWEKAETSQNPQEIAQIHEKLEALDAYSAKARAAQILSGLGFDQESQHKKLEEFSGGWRMRASLGRLLFMKPNILLLDEPTNYLDLEGSLWLADFLKKYPYSAFIISHDRNLLNNSIDAILHLSEKKLTLWSGNYESFLKQRATKLLVQQKQKQKQTVKRQQLESFINRFRAKASKAKQAQSRLKLLNKMVDIPSCNEENTPPFQFYSADKKPRGTLLHLEKVTIGYGDAPPILKNLNLQFQHNDRIALLGVNGSGKTSLAKLLSGEIKPKSGVINYQAVLKISVFSQKEVDNLPQNETPFSHLASLFKTETESAIRAKIAQIGLSIEKMDTKIQNLSGGEKTRLTLGLIGLTKPHLLILDEPTNHLDIEACEALIAAVNAFEGAVLIISHDFDFLNATTEQLWLVHDQKIEPFLGDMDDYKEHVLKHSRKLFKSEKIPSPQTRINKQQERKIAAQKRNAYKDLKKDIESLEESITQLESALTLIDKQLAEEATYQDKEKLFQLSQARLKKEKALQKAEEMWLIKSQDYIEKTQ